MGRLVTLEELEAYRQEIHHAEREGRVPRYRDPREVFNENPNKEDGFLVELSEDELRTLEDERQRAYQEREDIKAQVIQEIQDNGNVVYSDSVLPASAAPDEHNVSTPQMTDDQAQQLYDNSQSNDHDDSHSPGALANTAQSPSVAPDESVVPSPGSIEGAPEPMQSIVEAAALKGNETGSVHQSLVSTPNPEPSATDNTEQPENVESVTPATGGDNPTTVDDLNLPDLNEPTSVPSPTVPDNIAEQTAEEQQGDITNKITDPGDQQFQPEPGSNAGPTVPGADTIQTPTLNDEAAVPSEPTNADAVKLVDNPAADSNNGTSEPPAPPSVENGDVPTQETPPTSE